MTTSQKTENTDPEKGTTGKRCLNTQWGQVCLQVREDAMEVELLEVRGDVTQCAGLTAERVRKSLHDNGITHGVVPEAVKGCVDALKHNPAWQGSLILAEGCPPTVPGGADYTLFSKAKEVVVQNGSSFTVDAEFLDSLAVKEYLSGATRPTDIPEVMAKITRPGEVLVTKKEPVRGKAGYDVLGRVLPPPEFMEVTAGDHVEMDSSGENFTASMFGFCLLLERRLSVLSPLVLADDGMTVWYVQLPQCVPYRSPLVLDLTVLLKEIGVKVEVENDVLARVCRQLKARSVPGWSVVAQGRTPVAGENGELLFEGTDPPSALRDDGSIDYKVLNLVKTVEAGSHFATLTMPTKGHDGVSLVDEVLPAEPGKPLRVDAKANVRVEEQENGDLWYYADTEGVIQYQNGRLEIDPLYQVKGNVDFSTGNLDVDCCLMVAGNVCSDFTVKSTKDTIINGTLEPGAKLIVQGDLQVKGGIIGEKTEVVVMGNLQADFVQDAKIVVKGQIFIEQYVFSAVIRSVGTIKVGPGQGERGGSIVGGTVCSSTRIEVSSTGSPSNVPTTIVVEPAPHKLALLKQLKQGILDSEAGIVKIMRTLDLQAIEPEQIKELLAGATVKQRAVYVEILKQLRGLVERQQGLLKKKNTLRDALWLDVDQMSVQVNKAFYANTKVRIARKEHVGRTDCGRTTIHHDRTRLVVDSSRGDEDEFF